MKKTKIIPIFVPHLGCNHDCSFCNQKKITGVSTSIVGDDVKEIVENSVSSMELELFDVYIAFYGGSFTGIENTRLIELLDAAKFCVDKYNLAGIRCSTRPDYIDDEIMELLVGYPIDTIELGAQSMDDKVLLAANRGHTAKDVVDAVKTIRKYNVRIGIQTMIGLPGEDDFSRELTKNAVIDLKPDFVRIYPVLVIQNTRLATLFDEKEYLPLSVEKAIEIVKNLLLDYNKHDIYVLKVGLHSSESLNQEGTILGGPWHPSFHEKVLSAICFDVMRKKLANVSLDEYKNVVFVVPNKKQSQFLGEKKENLKKLQSENDGVNISVICQSSESKVRKKIKKLECTKFINV